MKAADSKPLCLPRSLSLPRCISSCSQRGSRLGKNPAATVTPVPRWWERARPSEGQLMKSKTAVTPRFLTHPWSMLMAGLWLQLHVWLCSPSTCEVFLTLLCPRGREGQYRGVFRLKPLLFWAVLHFIFGRCKIHRLYLQFRSSHRLKSLNDRKF